MGRACKRSIITLLRYTRRFWLQTISHSCPNTKFSHSFITIQSLRILDRPGSIKSCYPISCVVPAREQTVSVCPFGSPLHLFWILLYCPPGKTPISSRIHNTVGQFFSDNSWLGFISQWYEKCRIYNTAIIHQFLWIFDLLVSNES